MVIKLLKKHQTALLLGVFIMVVGFFLVWLISLSFSNFSFWPKREFSDELRTPESVFFTFNSDEKQLSEPIFSFNDLLFYKELRGFPADLNLKIPGKKGFKRAKVALVFKPLTNKNLYLEYRPEAAKNVFKSKALYNGYLHEEGQLAHFQKFVSKDGYYLLEKSALIQSADFLDETLAKYKENEQVQVFNFDYPYEKDLLSFEPNTKALNLKLSLVGKANFLTYTAGGPINYEIKYEDLNREKGADRFNLRLKKNGKIISYVQKEDDGNESDDGKASSEKIISVAVPNVSRGIYELEFDNSKDLYLKSLNSNLGYLVARKQINFLSPEKENRKALYAKEGEFQLISNDNFSKQKVETLAGSFNLIYKQPFNLGFSSSEKCQKNISDGSCFNEFKFLNANLRVNLIKDSYASFTKESYLDLNRVKFLEIEDLSDAQIVVAQKDGFIKKGTNGFVTSEVTFDVNEVSFDDKNQLYLRLNSLITNNPEILIDRIGVKFYK